mgnify:FL=1
MNTSVKIGSGVVAACAACCAVSVVPAFLAGTSLAAISAATLTWSGSLAALAVAAAAAALYLAHRKAATRAPSANLLISAAREQGCGCTSAEPQETPIACTLGADDFKQRAADIRDLARRALLDARQTPLTLALTYAPEAADEVRALMTKEQECCPFLTFGMKQSADAVV